MDVSNLGNYIRWPFEMLGKIILFFFNWWLEIGIVVATLYVFYFIFSRDVIGRIVEWWNSLDKQEEINNLKGGQEENV